MSPRTTARPGDRLDAIDTPALVLDLDAFELKLTRLAALQGRGMRLRPHAKRHKCLQIVLRQMALGAAPHLRAPRDHAAAIGDAVDARGALL